MSSKRAQRISSQLDGTVWTSAHEAAPEADRSQFVNPFNDRTILSYYRDIQSWHGYIRFLGLPHLRDEADIPIDSLYVTPDLTAQPISPDQSSEGGSERTSALTCVTVHPRMVVLGDPGSGKSTLVSWIAWHLSRGPSNPWTQGLGPLLPLPIVVRDVLLTPTMSFAELLEAFLSQLVADALEDHLTTIHEYLDRGQCLFLLDGLDEVGSESVRRGLWQAVREGVRRYPYCRWLLTSRQVGYDRVPFHQVELDQITRERQLGPRLRDNALVKVRDLPETWAEVRYVAPFQDPQIETFAHNWYARTTDSPAAAEGKARDLVSALHSNPSTLRLARVPNLLTLIALIHRIKARLPHGRAVLYDKIVEAYLESIDAYRGIQEVDYSLEEKKRWLAWVGFRMQRRRSEQEAKEGERETREILVDEDELLKWLEEAMARSPRAQDVAEPGAAARAFVDYIARRSGLLLPRGKGHYAFTHLSFQEFFAAFHLEERLTSPRWFEKGSTEAGDGPEDLRAYSDEDSWREPLVLLFGLLAGKPEWSGELVELLFGEGFSIILEDEVVERKAVARLLAEVATDWHSGLPGDLRERAWEVSWRWELRRQTEGDTLGTFLEGKPIIARTLLSVEEGELAAVLRSFLRAVRGTDLRRLNLKGGTGLQDLGWLAGLDGLEWLDLSDTGVSDLSLVVKLNKLQLLYLENTKVSDLGPLAELRQLEYLLLSDTLVSDLSPLAELKRLTLLNLSMTEVSDLGQLAGLKNLEWLSLFGTRVSDLGPLEGLRKLKFLDLSGTPVSDLTPLAALHQLEFLDLQGTAVSDLAPLSRMPRLRVVGGPAISRPRPAAARS